MAGLRVTVEGKSVCLALDAAVVLVSLYRWQETEEPGEPWGCGGWARSARRLAAAALPRVRFARDWWRVRRYPVVIRRLVRRLESGGASVGLVAGELWAGGVPRLTSRGKAVGAALSGKLPSAVSTPELLTLCQQIYEAKTGSFAA